MKKGKNFLCIALCMFVSTAVILVVNAATQTITAAIDKGKNATIELKNVGKPITKLETLEGTSRANVLHKIYRKGLFGYSEKGHVNYDVVYGNKFTTTWELSDTKDTKATWENTETQVGHIVVAHFTLQD